MDAAVRYWAFLSYSHRDRRVAERLHRALETYRIPPRLVGRSGPSGPIPARLTPIFRDRDELAASQQLGAAVEAALTASGAMIVLCSRTSARSRWVDAEVVAFEHNHPTRPLLCVLVDGEPQASNDPATASDECLPLALRARFGSAVGVADTAPVAVDMRPQGDGWRLGVQKLVASLAGLPLDQLVQRDAHRRHRRMAWLSAALAASAATFGTLAVFALQARDDARLQRAQAEGLVEFMLGDLREKLEPVGRLDVLDSIGLRALRYYDSQDLASLDADAIGRRARALHLVGEISDNRGDLANAGKAFAQAAASTGELLRRTPGNPQRLYEHAQSVFWVSQLQRERGELVAAEHGQREYAAIVARLIALEPDKLEWRKESSYTDSNVGTLLLDQGRAREAIAMFESSLGKVRAIVARQPDAANLIDYTQAMSWLSSARLAAGELAAARRDREGEIAVYRQMLLADGSNHQVEERLLYALRFLAELHLADGDVAAAGHDLDEAALLSARLLAVEPDNTGWIKAGAHVALDRADILLARQDPAAGRQLAQARMRIAALLARDPENFLWHRDLHAPALLLQARLQGDSPLRASALAQALRELDALHARTPHDRRVRSLLAQALMLAGDDDAHAGDHASALHAWQRGLALLPTAPALLEPDSRCVRAGLLARTGATAAAMNDFADLQRIGYRHPGYVTTAGEAGRSFPVANQPAPARRSQ